MSDLMYIIIVSVTLLTTYIDQQEKKVFFSLSLARRF